jgi:hypothetical protein
MIILAEPWEQLPPSASANDIRYATECAGRLGCRVFSIPPDFDRCGDAAGALSGLPECFPPINAIWIGYIPDPDRYAAIYGEALRKGVLLPNDPCHHRVAMELDLSLPLLGNITPESVVVDDPAGWGSAAATLGFPVFVKGTVQSRKAMGRRACVADDREQLRAIVAALFDLPSRTRGRVIVRRFVNLRHERTTSGGFPVGREYRVFVLRGEVLALGYYWEGEDRFAALTVDEEHAVKALALEAARRTGVPYLAVDIGQLDSGQWIVVEIGDGQFAGLSQVSGLKLWNALQEACDGPTA